MPGDMALVITLVRGCCAVVWWFLSWFEVVLRLYKLFIPAFIQRPLRALSYALSRRWEHVMEKLYGSQHVDPCVVVFSYEGSQRARALLADMAMKPRQKVIFIYSEHDIRRLVPDWQAYMVFIDYNEDNIILEPESGGHKALHLTTVKALEQKAYGSVSVVYLDDKGPEEVLEDDLFNPHLASAYAHPVLNVLSQQRRLFSVRKRWNHQQRWVIRDWLTGCSLQQQHQQHQQQQQQHVTDKEAAPRLRTTKSSIF